MKQKIFSAVAGMVLMLTVFLSPVDGLTGRITGPATTYLAAPGSAFEATFDCLHNAAAARGDGVGC